LEPEARANQARFAPILIKRKLEAKRTATRKLQAKKGAARSYGRRGGRK